MSRDEARSEAQQLLLRALASQPGSGMTEGSLRQLTGLGLSLFHEAMQKLMETQQVTVSQSDGRRNQTQYHLVQQSVQDPQEGPVSPLAALVLARLRSRPEGTRSAAKGLEREFNLVQQALDELEAFGLVRRSQVGMLVVYCAV